MSGNIENLKSVLKIRILDNTTQNNPLSEVFQEIILRYPQALYILRNLEKFKNSIKIHFFIPEIAANFNNFQESSTSAQKLLLTWCCTCIYQLAKALRLRKNVSQNNFCNIVLGFQCLHLDCVLFWRSKQRPTLTAKSRFWYLSNLKYDTIWKSCDSFN